MQRIKSGWRKFSQDRQAEAMYGRNEVTRMLTSLGYQGDYNSQAVSLFRRGTEKSLSHGRSIEAHAAACVYATLRINRAPVTLDDVAQVARVTRGAVSNMYSVLTTEHSLPIPVQHPADYVARIASEVSAPRELERAATELLKEVHDRQLGQGKHPAGLAAGAINALAVLTPPGYYYDSSDSPTISTLADAADVASPTVSTNTDRFEEFLCESKTTAQVAASLNTPIVCRRRREPNCS
jgi:transcription initiation factor TFIIB